MASNHLNPDYAIENLLRPEIPAKYDSVGEIIYFIGLSALITKFYCIIWVKTINTTNEF